ncbi:MAG: ATP-grasp domain-containing protein [Bryobacteraceae bacterium]|nr:ATP-grasp domain-containing protein [Bryobacteraceae bacterium]
MRLLLVAATTGYQTREFAQAAARLGVELVLATDRCEHLDDPWGDGAIAVRFEAPHDALPSLEAAGPFTGVVALGDRTTFLAALFAGQAGLPFHSTPAVEAARSKFLSKERFRAAGLRQPAFQRFPAGMAPDEAARSVPFPCVLKPMALSGSRGVIRADDAAGFVSSFRRIAGLLEDPDIRRRKDEQDQFIQVESFIPGREFAIEGLMTNGRLKVLAIFDKPDPLDGPYFEETIYVTPSRHRTEEIVAAVARGVTALGLSHGPVHAEVRVNSDGAYLLEIAARPIGGLCARALRFNGGISLEELVLRHALGEDVSAMEREPAASGVMMIPVPKAGVYRGVAGVEEARRLPGIEDVVISAKQGQLLKMFPEASSYTGFLFSRAATPEAAEAALREAHALLRFDIAVELMRK